LNYQKWNLSDDYLFAIRLEDNTEKSRILLQDEEIYVIHLTSSNRIRDLMLFQQTFLMGDKKISWNFRLAQHPDLFDFQIGLIRDAMTENFGLLLETGMAEEQG
jgi:hypothetical protein